MTALDLHKRAWELCQQSYLDSPLFRRFGNMEVVYYYDVGVNFIVFRGSDEASDWLTNLFFFSKKERGLGKFHRGYWKQIKRYHKDIYLMIPEARRKEPVVACGHSKGGAEAQLFTLLRIGGVDTCITFGSPKPIRKLYEQKQEDRLRAATTHYINPYDAVTKQPPFWKLIGKEVIRKIRKSGSEHPLSVYREFF